MTPLMVLGCASDAGESLLVIALCRWFARQGVRVAPFKAQNMSNNARVVVGGEIGVAQWLQAKAAQVEPDVRMNPVLLQPEAGARTQVIVRGVADLALSRTPSDERSDALWVPMTESFDSLAADYDLVVIEGAGSPAEINVSDQVNNRMVEYADAAGLLVADVERGGAFAHLFGTWSLVPDATRERLAGFVLNRSIGDPSLLASGCEVLAERTTMRDLGIVPLLPHALPQEEGVSDSSPAPGGAPRVVIARFPFGSNFDEFHLLGHAADVRWSSHPARFTRLDPDRDAIILPGSKHLAADLEWMRSTGIDQAVLAAARHGVPVIGVCGGAMMLGNEIIDPHGVEGSPGSVVEGLGILDYSTTMGAEKRTESVEIEAFGATFAGYEIRFGEMTGNLRFGVDGNVTVTTVHGLFEHPDFIEAVIGVRVEPVLEPTFEMLADAVEDHLDVDLLWRMVGR